MSASDIGSYGRATRGRYDTLYPADGLPTAAAVDCIAAFARKRSPARVLEFGIGTGRIALGLQRAGIEVVGIDASLEMLDQLKAKPGGNSIPVIVGDRMTSAAEGGFSVVVIAFNGILDERGPEAQVGIFRNAARHLVDGGFFIVESLILTDAEKTGEWAVRPRFVGNEHVEFQLSRYDAATNRIERVLLHLRPNDTDFLRASEAYASPWELDLMAMSTGFERVDRYGGWDQRSLSPTANNHVTIYRKLPEP